MTLVPWLGMAATSLFAALLQATNGFGFAVLAVPFFLLFAPPEQAIQMIDHPQPGDVAGDGAGRAPRDRAGRCWPG